MSTVQEIRKPRKRREPKPLRGWNHMATKLRTMRTDLGKVAMRKPKCDRALDRLFREDLHAAMTFLERAWSAAEELHRGGVGYAPLDRSGL